jgi:hypothetical protein
MTRLRRRSGFVAVLAMVACACLPASALAGGMPLFEGESVSGVGEHGATLEATIDPDGLETTYAFWLGREVCSSPPVGYEKTCHEVVTGPLGEGHIPPDSMGQTVSTTVAGLEADTVYGYLVVAVNSAGHVLGVEKQFSTSAAGGAKKPLPPVENKPTPFELPVESWVSEKAGEGGALLLAESERKQAEREAANKMPLAVSPEPTQTTAPETGGVSLDGTSIIVQGGRVAFMKLDCTASAGCTGKLALTARIAIPGKGRHRTRETRTVMIASQAFSVGGEEEQAVRVTLNGVGRALLAAHHGRFGARLVLFQLEPGSGQTQSKDVSVIERRTHRGEKRVES